MTRAIINSDSFKKIFDNKETLLAQMASSLTKIEYNNFKDNITCNIKNPYNLDYIISMPDDDTIKIVNTKTREKFIINLKK